MRLNLKKDYIFYINQFIKKLNRENVPKAWQKVMIKHYLYDLIKKNSKNIDRPKTKRTGKPLMASHMSSVNYLSNF